MNARWGFGVFVLVAGCGAGGAAQAVRPDAPTAGSALGEAPCRDVKTGGEPLVVDWKTEQRGDLEVAMKEGVAVVAYSCQGIKLLKDCHINGQYGFIGMTRREEVVRLDNSDEVKANLPLSGGAIGGELSRGATLDVAMVLVGKRRTTWSGPTKDDLVGSCDGATHYVRGATVGAFALDTGTRAKVRAAAELFVSASAASESKKSVRNADGDPKECQKADPDADKPPSQCGAPVRLVLAPILPAKAAPPAKAAAASDVPTCPDGLVYAGGKCTAAASATAYQCKPGDRDECKAQCDKGHAGSCATYGEMANDTDALKKGCDGGAVHGCAVLASMTKDGAAAAKLAEQACTGGDALGCRLLGRAYRDGNGVAKDATRAAALANTACDGGDDDGCADAAMVEQDPVKAAALHKRACDGNVVASCLVVAARYESGGPGFQNPILAEMIYRRACYRGSAEACAGLGRMEMVRPAGADADDAKRQFENACMQRVSSACAALKLLFDDKRPVFPDVREKNEMMTGCASGNARACANAGMFDAATGNAVAAHASLQRACTMGDAWGCLLDKHVGK